MSKAKKVDVTVRLDRPRNVDRGARTINFWGRLVWDKGPVVQLRLPWFEQTRQEPILEHVAQTLDSSWRVLERAQLMSEKSA